MRHSNPLLTSLGVLSFAATLGVLHLTRGPLYQPDQTVGPVTAARNLPATVAPHTGTVVAATAPAVPVADPARPYGSGGIVIDSTRPPLPTLAPAEVVMLRAQIENPVSARDRLNAISSLRTLGMSGDDNGYVRAALKRAMNDPNPSVKQNAEMAYDLVSSRYSATE